MRKKPYRLILEFVALTVPLAWLWLRWGRTAYIEFFVAASTPLFTLLGVPLVLPDVAPDRFISFVPFLALMLITPGMSVKRRTIGTAAGFLLIFLSHVGLVLVAFFTYAKFGLTRAGFSTLFPALLAVDCFPFVLWAVIANEFVKDIATRALRKVAPQPTEDRD